MQRRNFDAMKRTISSREESWTGGEVGLDLREDSSECIFKGFEGFEGCGRGTEARVKSVKDLRELRKKKSPRLGVHFHIFHTHHTRYPTQKYFILNLILN